MKKQQRLSNNFKKLLNVRRKDYSIWRINKDVYLKNPKSLISLKKCVKNWAGKTRKGVRKVSKTQSGNESLVKLIFA